MTYVYLDYQIQVLISFVSGLLHWSTPLEGNEITDEQFIHYLPAWQPDDINLSSLTASESETISYITNDDQYKSDSDLENEHFYSYVVGQQCARCLRSFNLVRRKHHCRRCGHIFCGLCSNYWQSVEGLVTTKLVRICTDCNEFLNSETILPDKWNRKSCKLMSFITFVILYFNDLLLCVISYLFDSSLISIYCNWISSNAYI